MNKKELLEFYNEHGWVKIEGFFDKKGVDQILENLGTFVKSEAPTLTGKDINLASDKLVNSIHNLETQDHQFFYDFIRSERNLDLATIFLRERAVARHAEFFAKPAKTGMRSPYHQDNHYWCLLPMEPLTAITVWVALDICDETNGGISYIDGSHKLGLLEHKNSYAPGSSQTVADLSKFSNLKEVTPSLQPGDILVHDALTVHFSNDNKSNRSRRGLTMQFQSKDAYLDEAMNERYLSALDKQVKMRQDQAKSNRV